MIIDEKMIDHLLKLSDMKVQGFFEKQKRN